MKKNGIINVANTAGFCFGVKRAIRMAHDLAQGGDLAPAKPWRSRKVHMLGDLVHNQEVIAHLEKSGIKKIARLGSGRGKTLLIRAHGAGQRLITLARARGYNIVDATCPMVRAIHKIVKRMDRKGFRIIVLGDRRHDEVQGIVGQISRKMLIIDRIENIPWQKIKKIRKAAIVVQSRESSVPLRMLCSGTAPSAPSRTLASPVSSAAPAVVLRSRKKGIEIRRCFMSRRASSPGGRSNNRAERARSRPR